MNNSQKSLLVTLTIGMIMFFLWKFSGIALSRPVLVDYSTSPYFPTDSTFYEWIIYSIFAVLLSTCLYFPFYLSDKINSARSAIGIILSVIVLFLLIGFLSRNIKGVLASNWFGEDYGFGVNITKVFFIAPIVYFIVNKLAFPRFPFKNLFYFFMMNFAIYLISKFISHPMSYPDEMPIRFILLDGYFVFLYALTFGLIGWSSNRVELNN